MLRIFNKEPRAKIVSAAEIRELREAFEQAMNNSISNILENRILDINEHILRAGRNLQTSTTYWFYLNEAEEKSIERHRFCSYITNYFKELGYHVSFGYASWLVGSKCYQYKLSLRWVD